MNQYRVVALAIMLLGCGAKQTPVNETPSYKSEQRSEPAAQDPAPVIEAKVDEAFKRMCEEMPCRKNVRISLKTPKGMFNFHAALFPPVELSYCFSSSAHVNC